MENFSLIVDRLWDQFYREIIQGFATYFAETSRTSAYLFIAYIFLSLLFYYFRVVVFGNPQNSITNNFHRVLLVIAHPDDECMFFGPAIVRLAQKKDCKIYLLCLSNGDYYKIGLKRKQELWDSCQVLGIPASNITLCNNPHMQDDPKIVWRKDEVAHIMLEHIESLNIDSVLTFDEDGVSGHYNHISIFNAMSYLFVKKILPKYCRVYTLQSVNIFRKYSFYMDLLMSHITSSIVCNIKQDEHSIIKKAMEQHRSQYVWFRKLYIRFSRYSFINSFREIDQTSFDFDIGDI